MDPETDLDTLAEGLFAAPEGEGDAGAEGDGPPGDEKEISADEGGEQDGDGNEASDDAKTDDEASDADDEGEGREDGDDGDGASTEPLYTIKVDGKEEQVSLKQALEGHMRHVDYTRKTQEVATARQKADGEFQQMAQARAQYAGYLESLQKALGDPSKEPTAQDWDKLRAEDPDRYAVEWTDYQRREQQRTAVKAEQDRVKAQEADDQRKRLVEHVNGERTKLHAALPELADQKTLVDDPANPGQKITKGNRLLGQIRAHAMKLGFSEAEVNQAYDHRLLLLVNQARIGADLIAKQAAARAKVENAPELPAPQSRKAAKPAKQKARDEAMKRLDRSGHIDDAVSLLLQ